MGYKQKIIDRAMKRLKHAVKADDHNRVAGIDDLNFANGQQWDEREKKRRADKGRPALTLNFLPKFVDQVVGDMLHNTPSIKISPTDSRGDVNIARIRQGIIAQIEYDSNAKAVYGYAAKQMVTCGYGAWRVLTRYTEENPFIQEAYLESVRNPFLVYMDPTSKDQNYADAGWGIIFERMPRQQFEEKYPTATYPFDQLKTGKGLQNEFWFDDNDVVTVAEYFERRTEKVKMYQLEDGRVVTAEELKELKEEWGDQNERLLDNITPAPPLPTQPAQPSQPTPPAPQGAPPVPAMSGAAPPQPAGPQAPAGPPQPPQPPQPPPGAAIAQQAMRLGSEPKVVKSRETEKTVIKQWIITSAEVLDGGIEGNTIAGKYIPLVLLKGKELNIEGKSYVYSLIRHAKDPQKLINYWNTAAAETIALSPKAPWLGTPRQFEGFENDYAAANVENFPFLKYNSDPDAPGPPQRQQPGNPPIAIFQQIQRGEDNLKAVIGMFGADVGEGGPERSGAAIVARQRPGDVANFEFMENLARAIMHCGRILNEMIPEIYDTERDVRIRNVDESESFVPVNTTLGSVSRSINKNPDQYHGLDVSKIRSLFAKNGHDAKFNDITAGKYDVRVTVGPSYTTQRQDSATQLLQLVQAMPQQFGGAADLIVRNLDLKDFDELETRLRKPLLASGMVKPRPGEPVPQLPPNPMMIQAQAKMQGEQTKLQMQQVKMQQEIVKLQHEKLKLQLEMAKAGVAMKGEQPRQDEIMEKMARLKLEADRLRLEEAKFAHQMGHDKAKHDLEREKLHGDISMQALGHMIDYNSAESGGNA